MADGIIWDIPCVYFQQRFCPVNPLHQALPVNLPAPEPEDKALSKSVYMSGEIYVNIKIWGLFCTICPANKKYQDHVYVKWEY